MFLFRPDGFLIVQRRRAAKDVCPSVWDLSAAEHVRPGESYERAAQRGLREELGVEHVVLEALGDVARAELEIPAHGVKDFELQQSFHGVFAGELRPDATEVAEVAALSLAELAVGFRETPADYTPWFRDTARRVGLVVTERQHAGT